MDRVREFLADLRLHLLIALEVGQGEGPAAAARELQTVAARIPGEIIRARERGGDARVFTAIEKANRIGGVFRLDAVPAS